MTVKEPLVVGVVVLQKKWHKHGFADCTRVHFLPLTPDDLTTKRLKELGVNVILHKLSDWLLSPAQLQAVENELIGWGGRVLDSSTSVALLSDRRRTCSMLKWFTLNHGLLVNLPPTSSTSELDTTITGGETLTLSFPIIRKPVAACSLKDSHSMCLFYRPLQVVAGPDYILQQYIPHDGVLYKVYVVGDAIRVQLRPSLDAGLDGEPHTFNSQAMKQAGAILPGSTLYNSATARLIAKQDRVLTFSKALQAELGLNLFGWDLIIESGTGKLYIIDVNYFPGFDEVDFLNLLCDLLEAPALAPAPVSSSPNPPKSNQSLSIDRDNLKNYDWSSNPTTIVKLPFEQLPPSPSPSSSYDNSP